MSDSTLLRQHNVRVLGKGTTPIVFAHGYGCNQHMWRFILPEFEQNFKIILFDYVGHGEAAELPFDNARYGSLDGFVDDLIAIAKELGLRDATFVGHSASASIGILAHLKKPSLFKNLILVCPSPHYMKDGDYDGGFSPRAIEELLDFLDSNHVGWSSTIAPTIMGNADRPELGAELTNSFCRTNPDMAKLFARATFLADNRSDLPKVLIPTLILQCSRDAIAPIAVGEYVQKQIQGSKLVCLDATGHCPHLSAPAETARAINDFLVAVKALE